MNKNDICILIPHYNSPEGLIQSVTSIGSSEEVDLLVIDDGSISKFDEKAVERAFKGKGSVFFSYLNKNQGIEKALNTGLKIIYEKNYLFVARLDCGDLCTEDRFSKQREFLNFNSKVYLVGSYCTAISPTGKFLYEIKLPLKHEQIKKKMYFNSMFIHPTVMFRTKAVERIGFYPTNYPAAEDYAYFFKFVKNFKTAILPESLVKIQIDDTGISAQKRKIQVQSRIKIIKENFYFGIYPITGLLRSYLLLNIPRPILKALKIALYKQ